MKRYEMRRIDAGGGNDDCQGQRPPVDFVQCLVSPPSLVCRWSVIPFVPPLSTGVIRGTTRPAITLPHPNSPPQTLTTPPTSQRNPNPIHTTSLSNTHSSPIHPQPRHPAQPPYYKPHSPNTDSSSLSPHHHHHHLNFLLVWRRRFLFRSLGRRCWVVLGSRGVWRERRKRRMRGGRRLGFPW